MPQTVTRGMFDLAPVTPARALPSIEPNPRRKVAPVQHVGMIALPGMSTARRDDAPVVRSYRGTCAQCGSVERLPVGDDVRPICSRCENGSGPARRIYVCGPLVDRNVPAGSVIRAGDRR